MGQRLVNLYAFAEKNGGLLIKMRIAMRTGVPSSKAAEAPDSEDLIAKAKLAIKEATGKDAPAV